MTVITKPITGEKKPSDDVLIFVTSATSKPGFSAVPTNSNGSTRSLIGEEDRRRLRPGSCLTQTCLTLTVLVALCIGFIGAIHVIKQIRGQHYYRGACRVPFPVSSNLLSSDSMISGHFSDSDGDGEVHGLQPVIEPELVGEELQLTERFGKDGTIELDYELDLEFEQFESFEFPEISHGRYIHDFKFNKTAIIDPDGKRCFVMPLDRKEVPQPRTVFEVIRNLRSGIYDLDIEEIRHDTRVVFPPLETLDQYGLFIGHACEDKTTFVLERVMIVKRSAGGQEKFQFIEMAGNKLIKYNILNLSEI